MSRFSDLTVIWRAPEDGKRLIIGRLWREPGGGYAFEYCEEFEAAASRGFLGLLEFRARAEPYRSPYLFATFAQRVPSPGRPDFRRMMSEWGVEDTNDPLEILARSGGTQLTDRIELTEYRDAAELRCGNVPGAAGADLPAAADAGILRRKASSGRFGLVRRRAQRLLFG